LPDDCDDDVRAALPEAEDRPVARQVSVRDVSYPRMLAAETLQQIADKFNR
jgi:hypothetical protein